MRVGVDISWAINERAGVGRYSYELVAHQLKIRSRPEFEFFASFLSQRKEKRERLKSLIGRERDRVTEILVPGRLKELFFSQRIFDPLPLFFRNSLDLYHAHTIQAFPLLKSAKAPAAKDGTGLKVLTVHDLSYIHFPDHLGRKISRRFEIQTRAAAEIADLIICDSRATERDLHREIKISRNKTETILLGASEKFRPLRRPADRAKIRRKLKLPKEFILFVGSLEPRKNLVSLIRAFSELPTGLRKSYPLVIAGGRGWNNSDIWREAKEFVASGLIRFLSFVEDDDLPGLYSLSTVFAYLPLLEGFGLPPLEAMSCGRPVLTSNRSSLPEVVGRAGLFADPKDHQEIASKLKELLENEKLRSRLGLMARARAKRFSWRKTAEKTLLAYQRVYRESQARS